MRLASKCAIAVSFVRILAAGAILPLTFSLPAPGQVLVETQNLAGVSEKTLDAMRANAARILNGASVSSVWRAMGISQVDDTLHERRIFLRVVSSRHSFSANSLCLGEALVVDGGGTFAVVYVDRVRDFAHRYRLPFDLVLAYTAVHEVGHLLLGNTAHSREGIMRTHWDGADTLAMRTGQLRFGEAEASKMARRIHGVPDKLARTAPPDAGVCPPPNSSSAP